MQFLAPLMLLGLLGVAVPIVIHLIGRRRAPVIRFAAIDFLLGSDKKVARRIRLREMILLVLRCLACAAIALVLAKPIASCSTHTGPAVTRGPQAAVLVIDDSYTMGYRIGDRTLFEQARDDAAAVLSALGSEAEVAIVRASEDAMPGAALSRDLARHRQVLHGMEASRRPADLSRAVRSAAALLAGSNQAAKRMYVFTAPVAAAVRPAEEPFAGLTGIEVHLVDPARDEKLANLAVVSARVEREPHLGPRGVRVIAEIASFAPERVSERPVTLWIAGRAVSRGLVTLEPGQRVEKRFSTSLPAGERAVEVVVALENDGLPADDRRYLIAELRREIRVLLVNGDPRTIRHDDELFYLETALRPGERTDSAITLSRVPAADFPRERLDDHDVIFLANVQAPTGADAARLEAWVKRGGGLFISVGDQVDADAYESSMAGLLPQPLRSARVEAAGGGAAGALRIGRFEATHPVFSVFSEKAPGLREATFHTLYLVRPTAPSEDHRTLARFSSGAPALIERKVGEGRVLLYTSTVDRDWTDLPIHPGFLPLMQQSAHYLARLPADTARTSPLVGQAQRLALGPEPARAQVTAPGGRQQVIPASDSGDSLRYTATDEPGFYRVALIPEGGATTARPDLTFAVNVDPRGSDVQPWTVSPPGSAPVVAGTAGTTEVSSGRRVELWHGIAVGLLLFLFGEAILTRRG